MPKISTIIELFTISRKYPEDQDLRDICADIRDTIDCGVYDECLFPETLNDLHTLVQDILTEMDDDNE